MAFAARTVVLGLYLVALFASGHAGLLALAVAGIWAVPLLTRPGHTLAPAGRPVGNP